MKQVKSNYNKTAKTSREQSPRPYIACSGVQLGFVGFWTVGCPCFNGTQGQPRRGGGSSSGRHSGANRVVGCAMGAWHRRGHGWRRCGNRCARTTGSSITTRSATRCQVRRRMRGRSWFGHHDGLVARGLDRRSRGTRRFVFFLFTEHGKRTVGTEWERERERERD